MTHFSTTDSRFISAIKNWCSEQAEVLALVRFRCGAGSRDYRVFSYFSDLLEMIQAAPEGACVTVFRTPKLPLRGVVDDAFIEKCVAAIPDGTEYLMFETVQTAAGKHSWYHYGSGESHAELRDDLQDSVGRHVVVGFHPSMDAGPTEAIDGVVPDANGVVKIGPY